MDEQIRILSGDWENMLNAIPDPIFILDKENLILKANKVFFDMIGASPDEVLGKKCYEIVHKISASWPQCPLKQSKENGRPHTEEVSDPKLGRSLLVTTSPIFDDKGSFSDAIHITRDITEFKKIQEELRKRVDSLEKFQRVTVDRELRMKELKVKIAELEAKLQRYQKQTSG